MGQNMKMALTGAVLAAGLAFAGGAQAGTCSPTGATITKIDSTTYATGIVANACEDFVGNIDANTTFIDGLNDGTFFAGEFAVGTAWSEAPFTADIGFKLGDWAVNFAPKVMNNVVIAVKGGNDSALFLWKNLAQSGSSFEGTFDMLLAGLIAGGSGTGAALSNFNVAGVFVDNGPAPVPLPAAGWLLAAGIGGLAALRRRKR
jgi:hypothetical protein